jgi:transposase
MIEREKAAEIRRLFFAEHFKAGTICAQLNVHRDVVDRVLGPMGRVPVQSEHKRDVLEAYKPFIGQILQSYPRLTSTRIYDMLCERGYAGSIRSLRRYVTAVRPAPRSEVFVRTETLPGEQAQVDWGQVGSLQVKGGVRTLWVFVMVLAYSRAIWAELVLDLSVHSLVRSLVRAAQYFGGVTRQWLFDNPKTVVLERHGDVVHYQKDLLDLSATFHVQPRLCGVRKPNQKGSVERAVRYLKERFFAARSIYSIEHGNEQLMAFIEDIAMQRRHPVDTERTVAEVFERDEKPHLLSLPSVMPSTDQILAVSADKTAFIRFDKNRYSVPPDCANTTVTLVASDTKVSVIAGDLVVAEHQRCWGRNQPVEAPEHRMQILEKKRAARDGKGRDQLCEQVPRFVELLQRWADAGHNMGSLVARALKLLDLYGPQVLSQAANELIDRGGCDYGALCLLCDKHLASSSRQLPLNFGTHVLDRDVIEADLGGYDE